MVYGLNYLDKTTLSYASVMGIKKPHTDNKMTSGIDLSDSQYSWLGRWVEMSDTVSILILLPYEITSTANPYIGVSYIHISYFCGGNSTNSLTKWRLPDEFRHHQPLYTTPLNIHIFL